MISEAAQSGRHVNRMVIEDQFFDLLAKWWSGRKHLPFIRPRKDTPNPFSISFNEDFNAYLYMRLLKRKPTSREDYPLRWAPQKEVEAIQKILNASPDHQYALFRAWCASAD